MPWRGQNLLSGDFFRLIERERKKKTKDQKKRKKNNKPMKGENWIAAKLRPTQQCCHAAYSGHMYAEKHPNISNTAAF